jgi:hypothetical protein
MTGLQKKYEMNRHIIQKQVVELSLNDMRDFHGLADSFTSVIKYAASRLSNQFDKLADEQTIIIADYLEIDLGSLDWDRQQDHIGDMLVELIVKKVSGLPEKKMEITTRHPETMSVLPASIRQWLAWKEYLQTGLMPWFGTQAANLQEWESILLQSLDEDHDQSITNIIQEVLTNTNARNRLLLVFSSSFIESIVIATGHASAARLGLLQLQLWIEVEMQMGTGTLEQTARNILLARLYDNNPAISFIMFIEQLVCLYPHHKWLKIFGNMISPAVLTTVFPQSIQKTIRHFINALLSPAPETEFRTTIRNIIYAVELEPHFSSKAFGIIDEQKTIAGRQSEKQFDSQLAATEEEVVPTKQKQEPILISEKGMATGDEPLYVPYAGLVIAAPFLPVFFETIGLTDAGIFRNADAQVKAVRLAGFLANGKGDTPDWELTVPKILCGLDPADTINTEPELDKDSLQEAADLLDAMVRHWSALGRSSADALQQGFLERNGKLSIDNQQPVSGWLLEVEAKTIDILLQKIPWGFGTIKLPWMTKMLRTEWQGYL